jgi:hypothetical protein
MYSTGDFIATNQQFSSDLWGPTMEKFMDYLVKDLAEKHWNSIFSALTFFSARLTKEEAVHSHDPEEMDERVPLPLSDPPSPGPSTRSA